MPTLDDWLEELTGDTRRNQTQKPWPEPNMSWAEEGGGSGPLGIAGTLAQIGGTVANLIPGGQVVGVPLSVGGAALSGAGKEGIGGAVKGAAKSGLGMAGGQIFSEGLNTALGSMKSPIDTGSMTGFSEKGAPYTIPGVRPESVSTFSSQGKPMTVPASPKDYFGVDWKGGGS